MLCAVLIAGFFAIKSIGDNTAETRYLLAVVEKGELITSISGSGQISATDQTDLKAKSAGDILSVPVKAGQEVKKGALIASVDATDALKAVRDAEIGLRNAELSYDKIVEPTDALALMQSERSLDNAVEAKKKAAEDLLKSYDDAFTTVSNFYLQLPAVMSGLENIINGTSYASAQKNLEYYGDTGRLWDISGTYVSQEAVRSSYLAARSAYDRTYADYKNTSRSSDTGRIEAVLNETYNAARLISDCVKNTQNFLAFLKDLQTKNNAEVPALLLTHQSSAASYLGIANNQLSPLLSSKTSIKNAKSAIDDADYTIAERAASLEKTKEGPSEIELNSANLSIEQRKNSLKDARENLANCSIRAPFDGTIAKLNIKKGDTVSANAAVATLITKQRTATISLNEVDVSNVAVGQKATLTFDAVSNLTIPGEVSEVDTIGTVSQGVVTYNVKILFGTQDARVKPGMSVTASVITAVKTDVLLVPNSAIKTRGDSSYIEQIAGQAATNAQEIASPVPPKKKFVEVGISNDSETEIISGLNEGELIVSRTITQTAKTTTQSTNIFGGPATTAPRGATNGTFMRFER